MNIETAPLQNEYVIAAPGEPIVNITAYTAGSRPAVMWAAMSAI